MARFPLVPTAPEPERAILVGVEWRDNAWPLDRSLDELERLAHTAGAQCVARLSQRLVKPYPKSFIGSGKVEELCGLVHRMDADVVIFDDDLTPSQQSYLEKAVGEPVTGPVFSEDGWRRAGGVIRCASPMSAVRIFSFSRSLARRSSTVLFSFTSS